MIRILKQNFLVVCIVFVLFFAVCLAIPMVRIHMITLFERIALWLYPENLNRNGELLKIFLSFLAGVGIIFGVVASFKRAKAMEGGVLKQGEALEKQSEQIEITRKAQTDERFKNAVEHLGSDKEPIILGGVAELHQIAKDNINEYADVVFNILCSYIRTSANTDKHADEINKTVIQTIINYLFKNYNKENYPYKGLKANLSFSNLLSLDLNDVNFIGADLSFCYISDIKNSNLKRANLTAANLTMSRMEDVDLTEADLFDTLFRSANLKTVRFANKDLINTIFIDSELKDITINNLSILQCKFISSHIFNVTFKSTEVRYSVFTNCYLSKVNFNGINDFSKNDLRASILKLDKFSTNLSFIKFNGCRGIGQFNNLTRLKLEERLKECLNKKANLEGTNINKNHLQQCELGELTELDTAEITNTYNACLELSKIEPKKKKNG